MHAVCRQSVWGDYLFNLTRLSNISSFGCMDAKSIQKTQNDHEDIATDLILLYIITDGIKLVAEHESKG